MNEGYKMQVIIRKRNNVRELNSAVEMFELTLSTRQETQAVVFNT